MKGKLQPCSGSFVLKALCKYSLCARSCVVCPKEVECTKIAVLAFEMQQPNPMYHCNPQRSGERGTVHSDGV